MKIYDILVIGAGPAGSIFSCEVSKSKTVIVLDSKKEITRKVCGEYLCPLGVKYLRDMGYFQSIKDFNSVLGMKIFTPKGVEVDTYFPETNTFTEKGLSLNRQSFDQSLLDNAKSKGVEFKFNMNVSDITHNGSYWEIRTHCGLLFYSRLLIGADGRRSIVSKKLNLTKANFNKRIAIHTWVSGKNKFSRSGQMHLFDDGAYIGIDPISENEVNVSLVCDAEITKEFTGPKETLNYYLEKSKSLSSSILNLDKVEKVYCITPVSHATTGAISNHAALIGDAAGILDPLTGEGIFNAIWTAKNLADSLNSSQSNIFDHNFALRDYEKKRKSFFRQKIIVNTLFQWIIKQPIIIEMIAKFLNLSIKKRNSFVGIIGNIYKPLNGILRILF